VPNLAWYLKSISARCYRAHGALTLREERGRGDSMLI
jgi:hypothetical protein